MKKVLIVLLLACGGWVGFQSYRAGHFSLYAGPESPEAARIRELETRLRKARERYAQAGRAAGVSGVDTTAQADAAQQEIKRLERELAELREKSAKD